MTPVSRIFLIGARGSGKTTTARLLARKLGWDWLDLDVYLEEKAAKTIREIVGTEGWDKFRDLESRALRSAINEREEAHLVIATGGGVILRKANRDFMTANGAVVWLKADAPCLTARLAAAPAADQRPPLTNLEMEEEIRAILKEREPLYLECARHIANAENPPEQVCENIAKILRIPS